MNIIDFYRTTPKAFISSKQAARRLGISSSRLRILANQGRVSSCVIHPLKGWQFLKTDLTVSPGVRGPAFGLKNKAKLAKKASDLLIQS